MEFEVLPSGEHETESDETPRTVTSPPDDAQGDNIKLDESKKAASASTLFLQKPLKNGAAAITESLAAMQFPAGHEAKKDVPSTGKKATPKVRRRCSTSVLVDLGKVSLHHKRMHTSALLYI